MTDLKGESKYSVVLKTNKLLQTRCLPILENKMQINYNNKSTKFKNKKEEVSVENLPLKNII
jgi:hypothetical protein